MKYSGSVLSVVINGARAPSQLLTYLSWKTRSFGYACSRLCCVCAVLCVLFCVCSCLCARTGCASLDAKDIDKGFGHVVAQPPGAEGQLPYSGTASYTYYWFYTIIGTYHRYLS